MNQYQEAASGLKKMFIAQIGEIACSVVAAFFAVMMASFLFLSGGVSGASAVLAGIAGIGAIVFLVISVIGLNAAGHQIDGCKTAFMLTIAQIVVSVLEALTDSIAVLSFLFTALNTAIVFLVAYFVCTSVAAVLREQGAADAAEFGEKTWKIYFIGQAAIIAASVLNLIPLIKIIGGIVSAVGSIVSLVAGIMYIMFLYKSYHALGA